MDKINHCVNHNRFIPIDTEELSGLELIGKNISKTNEIVEDNKKLWEDKTNLNGDHKGTWCGLKPSQANETIGSMVEELNNKVNDINNNTIPNINVNLSNIEKNLVTIIENIDSTNIKKGDSVSVDYIKNLNLKNYYNFFNNLRMNYTGVVTCIGDSITYGYDITSENRQPVDYTPCDDGSINEYTRATVTYPQKLQACIREVYPNFSTITKAFSGDTALKGYYRHFKKHMGNCSILMYGINDCYQSNLEEYTTYMEQLIIREILWGKCVVLLTPTREKYQHNIKLNVFLNSLDLLAKKYDLLLVDLNDMLGSYEYTSYSDTIHLNGYGYGAIGARLSVLFVGNGYYKTKQVFNGTKMLTGETIDGTLHKKAMFTATQWVKDTPNEYGDGGIHTTLDDGFILYSFYNNVDDIVAIPKFYGQPNQKITLELDFKTEQPQPPFKRENGVSPINSTEFICTSEGYSKLTNEVLRSDDGLYMPLSRGYHTLKIGGDVTLYGIDFKLIREMK